MGWLLKKLGKDVEVATNFEIRSYMSNFPDIDQVTQYIDDTPDYDKFDLILTVDANSWGMLFGEEYHKGLPEKLRKKTYNIDHHEKGIIQEESPDRTIREKASSAAQVAFIYLIEPVIKSAEISLDSQIGEYLYHAIVGDTGGFRWNVQPDTYAIASKLLGTGINHAKFFDENWHPKSLVFLDWALSNIISYPALRLHLLLIDKKDLKLLERELGGDWGDYKGVYAQKILRTIEGYDYGVTISYDPEDDKVGLGFRTRNYGDTIEILNVFDKISSQCGGHRNAGGGTSKYDSVEETKSKFLDAFKEEFSKLNL